MRNLKSIITIIAISLATTFSVSAADIEPSKITKNLRTEIVSMLGDKIPTEFKSTSSAEISFMVNNENEVVVITVDSKLNEFSSFVKNKLNYKKINVKGIKIGEIYKVPVKIKVQ